MLKRLLLVIGLVALGTVARPAIMRAISEPAAVLLAQDIEVGGEEGPGCEATCSPMPSSCSGGNHTCQAMQGCTICLCTERNRSTGQCEESTPTMQSPKQPRS